NVRRMEDTELPGIFWSAAARHRFGCGPPRKIQSGVEPPHSKICPETIPERLMALTKNILFIHLVLSPLLFSRYTLDAFEYNKVALLILTALITSASGLIYLISHVLPCPPGQRLGWLWNTVADCTGDPIAVGFLLYGASAVVS